MTKNEITPLLVDLVTVIPEPMWISSLSYKEEFPAKSGDVRSFSFEGFIKTGNSEQDLVVGKQFYDQVIQQPAIKQLCGNTAEIKYKELAGDGKKANDPRGDANTGMQTSFTFTCAKGGSTR